MARTAVQAPLLAKIFYPLFALQRTLSGYAAATSLFHIKNGAPQPELLESYSLDY